MRAMTHIAGTSYVQGVANFYSYQQATQIAAVLRGMKRITFCTGVKIPGEEREEMDPAIKERKPSFLPR